MVIILTGVFFAGCIEISEKSDLNKTSEAEKISKVRFVDQVGSKYLFRGSSPLNEKETAFDYERLVKEIIDAGKIANVDVPQDFYMVDVSLLHLNIPSDRRIITIEEEFFRNNPDLGQFYSMDTWGTSKELADQELSEEIRTSLIKDVPNWLPGPLPKRVELLRKWLEDPNLPTKVDKPMVIYVHCYEGCDRTGAVIGAYLMRFKNLSWEEVNESNSGTCGRLWRCNYYQATQWYCAWLEDSQGLPLNCQSGFKCLRDSNDD